MAKGTVGFVLLSLLACSAARAERFERLFVGTELRLRSLDLPGSGRAEAPLARAPLRYELTLPHGLRAAHAELSWRIGLVVPEAGGSLSFPLSLGLRYMPFDGPVRPLLGGELGGYFSYARGVRQNESPEGPEWTWSMRALLGVHVRLARALSGRAYVDAMWAQTPEDARHRTQVFSGIGAGCELLMTIAPPSRRVLGMLLRGEPAIEGW